MRACVLATLVTLPTLLSCGPSNQEACQTYVRLTNAEYAQCGYSHLEMDEDETCPSFINTGGADCSDYYQCLQEAGRCCDASRQVQLQNDGDDCVLDEIDFAAMDACTGCR